MQEENDASIPPLLVRQSATPLVALRGMPEFHHQLSVHMPLLRAVPIEQLPYVTQKPKRPSYEGVKASGILKARWLEKHVLEAPAAIGVLIPWDESQPTGDVDRVLTMMRSAMQECAHRPHGTRLVVVLVASGMPGSSFNSLFQQLCLKMEMDPRLVAMVLKEPEVELRSGAARVEQALMSATSSFFVEAAKWSQQVGESLNRKEQMELVVRHGFKAAFYLEHRELQAALRQYMTAYNDLLELARAGGRERHTEVKSVAEVINYKICRLTLHTVSGKAAQAQLLRHVSHFKPMTGGDDRIFQHLAYLARQHVVFAELLKEAAVSVPDAFGGLHWEAAAWLTGRREAEGRRAVAAHKAPDDAAAAQEAAQLAGVGFWGQERHVGAARHFERTVNYGAMALQMWDEAVKEYERAAQYRRSAYSKVQKANLLFAQGRYSEAGELLTDKLLGDLDREGWLPLTAHVASLRVDIARALKSTPPFVLASLRVADRRLPSRPDLRQRAHDDLALLVAGFPLELPPESLLRTHPSDMHDMAWAALDQPLQCPSEQGGVSLVTFKASFSAASYVAGQDVTVNVRVTSHLHAPLKVSSIEVECSDSRYSFRLRPPEDVKAPQPGSAQREFAEEDLVLQPGVERLLSVSLRAEHPVDLLTCAAITLCWGAPPVCIQLRGHAAPLPAAASFVRSPTGPAGITSPALRPLIERELSVVSGPRAARQEGWVVTSVGTAKPEARVTLESEGPALIGEYHRVTVRVACVEGKGLKGASLRLSAGTEERGQGGVAASAEILQSDGSGGVRAVDALEGISIPELPQGGAHTEEVLLVVQGDTGQTCTVRAQLQYEGEGGEAGSVEETMAVLVVTPMTVAGSYSVLSDKQLVGGSDDGPGGMVALVGEGVMARVVLEVASPHKILLEGGELRLNASVAKEQQTHSLDSWAPALKAPIVLASGDRYCFQFPVVLSAEGEAVSPGSVAVRWCRAEKGDDMQRAVVASSPSAVAMFKLPEVRVRGQQVALRTVVPPQGVLGELLAVELVVENKTASSVEYQVEAQPSETFLLAGFRSTRARVLPCGALRVAFNLVPIAVGLLHPPKILLKWKQDGQEMQQAACTAKVFIQPPDLSTQDG